LVLDPGDGGRDSGAVSRNGEILEKTITLAVGLYARRFIARREEIPIIPYLTRKEDAFVSLSQRVALANDLDADLFLSIHCNARKREGILGIEIETFHHMNASQRAIRFSQEIQRELIISTEYLAKDSTMVAIDRGIKRANYYVLRKTRAAAALTELGFISDDEEAAFLSQERNQRAIAAAIVRSVERFINSEWS